MGKSIDKSIRNYTRVVDVRAFFYREKNYEA